MAINAYDVQLCLWKMLKISSKTCYTISTKHPYASSALLFLFILYICVPLLFWILIYSLPLLVCTCIIFSTFFYQNATKYKENEEVDKSDMKNKFTSSGSSKDDKNKKLYNRVHSVRRRRAKEIMIEEVVHQEEEKNAVSSTNFNCDMIDKNALIEESPKEIREVEVDITSSDSLKHENNDEEIPRLGILIEDEDDDEEKNVMEMGISDAERNKRLESLIAKRRSRQMVSLQVRRSLMNMDKNDHSGGQIASLILPKINTMYSPSRNPGQFSPSPGSAPSVLIPMRNPFDLPYDPHEEKPDLTGDSFNQEYTSGNNRENMVYCRHESFSLGSSLTVDRFFQNQSETSSVRDFGFRQRSSTRFQFFRPGNDTDKEFSPITKKEPCEASESKTNINNPDTDQIKEIIQVHENDNHNHSDQEGDNDGDESKQIPQSDFNSSSSSPSSSSSSEEDEPVFKIDREAILKSLSSMRRNALIEIENNERIGENNLTYANSALENASKLKRHGLSYSIASDMNVEVSEVSSPPLTIDENMSNQDDQDASTHDGEEADETRSDGHDMVSIGDSREQPLTEKHCIQSSSTTIDSDNKTEHSGEIGGISAAVGNYLDVGQNQIDEVSTAVENYTDVGRDQVIEDEQINEDLNDDQEQSLSPDVGVGNVQSSRISPKSVLLPTLSLLSFDPYIDHEEVHQSEGQIGGASSPVELENPTAVIDPLRDPTRFDGDGEAVPISEISSNQDMEQESSEPTKAPTQQESSEDTLIPSVSPTTEGFSEHKEGVIGQSSHDDNSKPDGYEDHTESSNFHQGILHDEGQTTSTSSNGTQDKLVQDFDAYETPIALSEYVEDAESSEYCKSNEDDRKIQHYPESQVDVMPETIEVLNNETKVADQE